MTGSGRGSGLLTSVGSRRGGPLGRLNRPGGAVETPPHKDEGTISLCAEHYFKFWTSPKEKYNIYIYIYIDKYMHHRSMYIASIIEARFRMYFHPAKRAICLQIFE